MASATVKASADHGAVRVRLSGEIDLENVSTVDEQICAAVSGQPIAVSVELTNLTYMDSVGLACGTQPGKQLISCKSVHAVGLVEVIY